MLLKTSLDKELKELRISMSTLGTKERIKFENFMNTEILYDVK